MPCRTHVLGADQCHAPPSQLANHGWREACRSNAALALGLNTWQGKIVYPGVAEAFGDLPAGEVDLG